MSSVIPQTPANYDSTRVIERPDGFYWQDRDSGEEFGPFATLLEAVADMEAVGNGVEVGESLEEAEDEVGIADWIDPDTGLPAEGGVPRTEDH
ncbi:hypothetical protein [Pseudothauera rhizosphaerae]|uniref:Uncharacterized protein n=1 Tax=Pseudothauera rhizosphaerae TaxID=2565932 RepID=A0A4S4AWB4_9RHOO|nr:hypothetical protein [Pseudothauera rhizosphaerae]THF64281.1 hypothetical protein E6O51_02905 [Pseudothauera rhizosphaerae]